MPGGLTVTLFGNRAPLKRELDATVNEARRAGIEIQKAMRTNITSLESRARRVDPESTEGIKIATQIATEKQRLADMARQTEYAAHYATLLMQKEEAAARVVAEAEKVAANRAALNTIIANEREAGIAATAEMQAEVAARAAAEAEKVAIVKASQLAMLATVARNGGVGSVGGGSHGGTGVSGIMGEMFVILRELGRGNFARIPGSITLLAQRMGLLGVILKSSAADAVVASAAQNKLAASSARAALAMEAKAEASYRAMAAEGADAEAAYALAEADQYVAVSARAAAVAEAEKAEAALAAAETEAAAATISLGPIGWLLAAVLALGAGAYFLWRHWKRLAEQTLNLKNLMDTSVPSYKSVTEATEAAAKAAQEYAKWLKELHDDHKTLADRADLVTDALERQARAQAELADAQKANALAQVALDEKTGKITRKQALEEKAKIEKQYIADKAANELKAMNEQYDREEEFYNKSVTAEKDAEAAATAAENKANENPEAVSRRANLDTVKEHFQTAQEIVTEMEKNAKKKGLTDSDVQTVKVNGDEYYESLNFARKHADELRGRKDELEGGMTADEQAAQDARKKAEEAKGARKKLEDDLTKRGHQINDKASNDPALVAAQQKEIDIKLAEDEAIKNAKVGREATSREKVGVGAPGIALLDVNKQQLLAQRQQLSVANATLKAISALKPKSGAAEEGKF